MSLVPNVALAASPRHGAETVDHAAIERLKQASRQSSEVAETVSYLSDVYGPRMSGTPRYLEMAQWVENRLRGWGIEDVRLESFGGDLRGWEVSHFAAAMTAPVFMSLDGQPVCCSRSTDGEQSSPVTVVDFYDRNALEPLAGTLRGRILLHPEVTPEYNGVRGRWSDEALDRAARRQEAVTPDGLDGPGSDVSYVDLLNQRAAASERGKELARFLIDEGVAAVLRSSYAPAGIVNNRFDTSIVKFHRSGEPQPVPFFVIPREKHARLLALHAQGVAPEVTLNLTTSYHEDPRLHVNLVAEIPGADERLCDEVVYLGAHLDSVEAATGASDNAVGAATAMEVLRMIADLGLQPRRTVRLGLWGGEEQGLLGSHAYVERHYGNILTGTFDERQQLVSAYFNHDNNGYDIRGIFLRGHEAIRPVFQAYLDPYSDYGANTVTVENCGGTDVLTFDAAGIPSFEWIQDPGNYFSHQLHTNLDAPSLLDFDSVRRNAAIIAGVVYHTAVRDDRLPRET